MQAKFWTFMKHTMKMNYIIVYHNFYVITKQVNIIGMGNTLKAIQKTLQLCDINVDRKI